MQAIAPQFNDEHPAPHNAAPLPLVPSMSALSNLLEARRPNERQFYDVSHHRNLAKHRDELHSACPFCEASSAFTLDLLRASYRCSQCREHGNARDLFTEPLTLGKSSVGLRLTYSAAQGLRIGHPRPSDEVGLVKLDLFDPLGLPRELSYKDADRLRSIVHLNLSTNDAAILYHKLSAEFSSLPSPLPESYGLCRLFLEIDSHSLQVRRVHLGPELPSHLQAGLDHCFFVQIQTPEFAVLTQAIQQVTSPDASLPYSVVGSIGVVGRLLSIEGKPFLELLHSPDGVHRSLYSEAKGDMQEVHSRLVGKRVAVLAPSHFSGYRMELAEL